MPIKVIVANIHTGIKNQNISDETRSLVFELKEINEHLNDGWTIWKYDIVTPPEAKQSFSIVYYLEK